MSITLDERRLIAQALHNRIGGPWPSNATTTEARIAWMDGIVQATDDILWVLSGETIFDRNDEPKHEPPL